MTQQSSRLLCLATSAPVKTIVREADQQIMREVCVLFFFSFFSVFFFFFFLFARSRPGVCHAVRLSRGKGKDKIAGRVGMFHQQAGERRGEIGRGLDDDDDAFIRRLGHFSASGGRGRGRMGSDRTLGRAVVILLW